MPTDREVELYFFDVWEAQQMLGNPCSHTIIKHLRSGRAFGVKHGPKWMIAPDQIGVLRSLIPYSCRPDSVKEPQGFEVRSLLPKLLRWWTSTRTFARLAGIKSSLSD